jgi:hypothetical protein
LLEIARADRLRPDTQDRYFREAFEEIDRKSLCIFMRFLRWLERWRTHKSVDVPETVNMPSRRLVVYLRSKQEKQSKEHTAELDFWDVDDLERQLASFRQQRRKREKYRCGVLYEFKNRKGDVLAFTEERYVRHRVIDLRG